MQLKYTLDAFCIFDSLRMYTKAIECLDNLDDNNLKFMFYAQKG